jgi:hypothetical protein
MLSFGPRARQFSPSQDLLIGKSPDVGNVHYRHPPGYRLEAEQLTAEKLPRVIALWITLGNVDVTLLLLRRARLSSLKRGII